MALSNSQYDAIMREYDQIRFGHQNEQQRRITEIYEKIPAIKALDLETARVGAARIRSLLTGRGADKEELQAELEDLRIQKTVLLKEAGYPEDYLMLQYSCKKCQDTGYINNHKCTCFKAKEIELLYHQSALSDILKQENFDTFSYEWYDDYSRDGEKSPRANMREVVEICLAAASEIPEKKINLLLTGSCGVGKTFMTHCIAKALLDRGVSVLYLSAPELFEIIGNHQFRNEEEAEQESLYHHIYDCDLLIIDDLGTEMVNNFTIPRLFDCLNDRDLKGRSVVISTNQSLNQLRDIYSERISSRLFSNYQILNLYGDDIRIRKRFS